MEGDLLSGFPARVATGEGEAGRPPPLPSWGTWGKGRSPHPPLRRIRGGPVCSTDAQRGKYGEGGRAEPCRPRGSLCGPPRGFGAAPARQQPRSPAGAFSTTSTWTPAPPPPPPPVSAGNLGGGREVDGLIGFGTYHHPPTPPFATALPAAKVGRGTPRCRAARGGGGGAPQGAARWGLIRAGLWDESCRASVTRIPAGILGDGGLGRGGWQGEGSRCCESAAPKSGWAPFWTRLGIKIRLRLLGSSRTITRASRAGYRARMLFHFGGWKRGAIQ